MKRLLVISSFLLFLSPLEALAQEEDSADPTEPPAREQLGRRVDRVLTTAGKDVVPEFEFWKDEELDSFIKPIVQMSSSLVLYMPQSDAENSEFANRVSTLFLGRIGFEGELFGFVTFRTLFERNLGFSISRNGPVGTSVWEGTASWQARENYIRLSKWGLSLTGGIFPDPASVDYISENILDSFGMDPFVRDPLLISGFNQGQGLMLRYRWRNLSAGFGFTGGNPLTSSLSFGFGGEINQFGTLFSAPLRALNNGFPGSNIHMNLFTPSLMYEDGIFGLKLVGQFYLIDNDVTQEEDVQLEGYNLKASGRVTFIPEMLRFYATGAFRSNDRVDLPDTTELAARQFRGSFASAGLDFDFDRLGLPDLSIGGNYFFIFQYLSDPSEELDPPPIPQEFTFHYINVGATYWLWDDVVSTGFRWARLMADTNEEQPQPVLHTVDSFIFSLRLII
jgi:hypothetical protein